MNDWFAACPCPIKEWANYIGIPVSTARGWVTKGFVATEKRAGRVIVTGGGAYITKREWLALAEHLAASRLRRGTWGIATPDSVPSLEVLRGSAIVRATFSGLRAADKQAVMQAIGS